mgnify:CR=1 FL=1
MPSIFAADRWVHEDGRSWRYSGPTQTSISDAPIEVREAAKSGWVTDKILAVKFSVGADGRVTQKESSDAD